MKKFAALGECMLELRPLQENTFALNFAGDTFNTTLYLARYRQSIDLQVDYITALGNDPYSQQMLTAWQQEGISTQLVQQLENALPGLYFIYNDAKGERHFYYYRSQSAARQLFHTEKIAEVCQQLLHYDYLYCSGISFAILDAPSRQKFITLLQQAKQAGVKVILDNNYRPKLWEDKTTTQKIMQALLPSVDIALFSFDDEQQLWGDQSPLHTIDRLKKYNINEIVIKQNKEGCLIYDNGKIQTLPAPKIAKVIDATAAGDSFNAAYIAARIKGLSPIDAAHAGQQLASTVVGFKGAIIPKEAMPDLFSQ